ELEVTNERKGGLSAFPRFFDPCLGLDHVIQRDKGGARSTENSRLHSVAIICALAQSHGSTAHMLSADGRKPRGRTANQRKNTSTECNTSSAILRRSPCKLKKL